MAARQIESVRVATPESAVVLRTRLTDGSVVFNVQMLTTIGGTLLIGCPDEKHAHRLARELNDTSWVEWEGGAA